MHKQTVSRSVPNFSTTHRWGGRRGLLVLIPVLCLAALLCAPPATAETYSAGPANYHRILKRLHPGDVLRLEAGYYTRGLRIHDLHGTSAQPIVIEGPADGEPAVLLGQPRRNVVSIKDASFVVIRNLEIDGRGAFVDGVKAEGDARFAHHITLENLFIHNLVRHQQSVGISTKCPAWDWVVRGNRIVGVGTGMYLGDSDGSDPFIGGLIEDNEVVDTIGYNLQIKHQAPRPSIAGMPSEPRMTIIRRNRFVKSAGAGQGQAARPNVLIGHLPLEGPGYDDEYAIYANLFFQNPGEALFQGEGNLALYSNLFFNSHPVEVPAIAIQPHNDIPKRVRVFFNTVVHPWKGIRVLRRKERWEDDQLIIGNAVFAETPLQGGTQLQNLTDNYEAAAEYLKRPVPDLADLDFTPRSEKLRGLAIDLSAFRWLPDYDRDFVGSMRSDYSLGAFARPSKL